MADINNNLTLFQLIFSLLIYYNFPRMMGMFLINAYLPNPNYTWSLSKDNLDAEYTLTLHLLLLLIVLCLQLHLFYLIMSVCGASLFFNHLSCKVLEFFYSAHLPPGGSTTKEALMH